MVVELLSFFSTKESRNNNLPNLLQLTNSFHRTRLIWDLPDKIKQFTRSFLAKQLIIQKQEVLNAYEKKIGFNKNNGKNKKDDVKSENIQPVDRKIHPDSGEN